MSFLSILHLPYTFGLILTPMVNTSRCDPEYRFLLANGLDYPLDDCDSRKVTIRQTSSWFFTATISFRLKV